MFPNTFIFSCFPRLTPLWSVTLGWRRWSQLITWSATKCPLPNHISHPTHSALHTPHISKCSGPQITYHSITPSLTHSPISCLTPGRQRREIFLSFYLSPLGSGASGSPITRWSISASFVAWPDCSFLGSLDLGPADYLQRNLSVEQLRSDWDAERTEGDQGDSWFLPLAMSVMGLYGLTVTMRIHQLLTMRKISDHLKHLCWLCWLLLVGDADESSLRKTSGHWCSQEGGLFASLS